MMARAETHLVGDEILRLVFQVVLDRIGGAGDPYRWGGDEIAALLPGAELKLAESIGQAIREAVERECGNHAKLREAGLKTTVSVGAGAFTGRPSADAVTAAVADLMKKVKAAGKNLVIAEQLSF